MDVLDEIVFYYRAGGFVMTPLFVGLLILWYALGYRFATLRRGSRKSVRRLVMQYAEGTRRNPEGIIDTAADRAVSLARLGSAHLADLIDDAFFDYDRDISKYSTLTRSIVMAAPLAGLLGTVTGMIETFNSLGDMSLFSRSGGIAGGISEALFTTQLGLAVAIPGLVVGGILDRKQQRFRREMAQIKELLCSGEIPVGRGKGTA